MDSIKIFDCVFCRNYNGHILHGMTGLSGGIQCVFAQKDVLVEKWERQMQADDPLAVTGTVFRWSKDLMKEE